MKQTLLILLLFTVNINSQTLKNYNGNYENGKANYQYYEEDNYERVFQGDFSYNGDFHDGMNYSIEIKGNYSNNLKNGFWSGKKTRLIYHYEYGNVKSEKTVQGNFLNGKKDGQWNYKQIYTSKDKVEKSEYSIRFSENTIVGNVDFINIIGFFGNNSEFEKEWKNKDENIEYIVEFNKNILIKFIARKNSNGEIIFKYDVSDIIKSLPNNTENKHFNIENEVYQIKQIDKLDEYNSEYIYILKFYNNVVSKLKEINSPISRIKHGSDDFEIKSPLIIYKLNKNEVYKKKEFDNYRKQADEFFENKQYQKAISYYENALEIYPYYKVIEENLSQSKAKLNEFRLEEFHQNIIAAEKFITNQKYELGLSKYKEALEIYSNSIYSNQKTNLVFPNDSIKNEYKTIEQKYKETQIMFEEYENQFNNSYQNYRNKNEEIKKEYSKTDVINTLMSNDGDVKYTYKKKKLFNAYQILQRNIENEISEEIECFSKINKLSDLNNLNSKILKLLNMNTRKIEKELNDISDPILIKQIFDNL